MRLKKAFSVAKVMEEFWLSYVHADLLQIALVPSSCRANSSN